MEEIGILDARNTFSALVERVERGEEVTITRHGKAVAKLVPVDAHGDDARRREAARRLRELRAGLPRDAMAGTSIRTMIEEGRR